MNTAHPYKHPLALRYLFLTELWERFAYWSVQSLMVLYMTKRLGFADTRAYLIYAAFASLLMATPIFGGYIADRFIGAFQSVVLGAVYLILGYALLSVPHMPSFYIGMAVLIIGNGLLKPNISALLGTCYAPDDPLRQSGYTLFYLGINTGTIIGIIACGFIANWVSYEAAFTLAACAIFLGLIVFITGRHQISQDQTQAGQKNLYAGSLSLFYAINLITASLVLIVLLYLALTYSYIANTLIGGMGLLLILYLIYAALKTQSELRGRFTSSIILTIFSIGFWALYMQMPMSMTLFVARDVNLSFWGFSIPPSTILSLNGMLILLLTPVSIGLWKYLARKNKEPSFAGKFSLACLSIGLGFAALTLGAHLVTADHPAPLWTVFLAYAGLTLGELFLSPIGLAMISLYAPPHLRSFMMGTWFFALAASTAIAGQLAKIASVPTQLQDSLKTAHIYQQAFIDYTLICLGAAALIAISIPWLKRLSTPVNQ